jgi:four helix bundle protein
MSAQRGADLAKRTKRFALAIIQLYSSLPKSTVAQVLGRQLLRSGTSVGAQYREAMRAKSVADFVSKVEGSLQEIEETRYWLELFQESAETTGNESVLALIQEADELAAILVASVRTAKRAKTAVK